MIIKSLTRAPGQTDLSGWPFDMPAVAQILAEGLTFTQPVTFLVGENGSGKSTIIESLAQLYGMNLRGGKAKYPPTVPIPESVAGMRLNLTAEGHRHTTRKAKANGYFLRAETAFDFVEFISSSNIILPGYWQEDLRVRSHGEGFVTVLQTMLSEPGLFLMDEPEAALSFTSTLRLLAIIDGARRIGAQVICATHSPVLASLPGAEILEFGDHGIRRVAWDELELVDHWRQFLSRPDAYLRHLLPEE